MEHMPQVMSMALGAGETTVMRMVTAYSEIANGGLRIQPRLIDRVQDRNGVTIYRGGDPSASDVLALADLALRQAKQQGRNRFSLV